MRYGCSDLTVIIPVLHRPHNVTPLLDSLRSTVPGCRPLFVCSPDDRLEHEAIDEAGAERIVTPDRYPRGDYAKKINLGYRSTTEPLMFLAADDLRFHPGWFEAATRRLDDTVQVVGTNDLANRRTIDGDHSTHTLVTRSYVDGQGTIDGPGKVLYEGYWHEFVDDEFVATAKHRGAYAHAVDSLVEHLHPMVGKAPSDALYALQDRRMRHGRREFRRRQHLWK